MALAVQVRHNLSWAAPQVKCWSSADALIAELPGTLRPTDVVLIKNSGAAGLKVTPALELKHSSCEIVQRLTNTNLPLVWGEAPPDLLADFATSRS